MRKYYDAVGLQVKLNEFTPEIKDNNIFLLDSFEEIIKLLNNVDIGDYTMVLYLNKTKIDKLLYDEDKVIPILNECMNKDYLKSMFYLVLAIKSSQFIINYSYESALIKKVYLRIKDEQKPLRKYISCILFDIILDNYQELNNTEESFSSDEFVRMSEEIENFIKEQRQILQTLNINFLVQNEIIEVENLYNEIIISLIKNKKLDAYEYSKDIMEQLDLNNIELSINMYEALKKLFDEKYKEDYIDNYKIKKLDNLLNEKIVNFYFILFKYIFKNSIYIYNIKFLLENKKSVLEILEKEDTKILEIMSSNEEKENLKFKTKFILKRFLDSEYYNPKDVFYMLKEVLKYFNNFYFQSKSKEIEDIEQILQKKDEERCKKYTNEYLNAKKLNKRFNILKYINDCKTEKFTENYFSKNIIKFWKVHEDFIHDKKSNISKLKFRKEIFNYFTDEKNKTDILRIFRKDEIDFYIKNYFSKMNLETIKTYYKNFYFESKKEEIELLSQNKENIDVERYMKDLELAKKMNYFYTFFSKIFKIDSDKVTEKEVHSKLKEWENIEKMLDEEKFEIEDDNIKIRLFIYFNNEKNKQSHNKILNEKSYGFLIEQRKEVEDVILNYYQIFFPDTKKKEIESIKNGKINDEDLIEYITAKKINLRKPLIFSLLDEESNNHEKEMKIIVEKWEQIEKDINNRDFINIKINDKQKIIKFFQNKDNEDNEFIKEIFNEEIIDEFLNFNEEKLNRKEKIVPSEPYKSIGKKKEEAFKKMFYCNNIFKSKLEILLALENKIIKIHDIMIDRKIRMDEEDFKQCRQYFSEEKESENNKIFEFLEKFKQRLVEDYNNNFKLILGLVNNR